MQYGKFTHSLLLPSASFSLPLFLPDASGFGLVRFDDSPQSYLTVFRCPFSAIACQQHLLSVAAHNVPSEGRKGGERKGRTGSHDTHTLSPFAFRLIGQGVKAKFTHTAAQGYDQHPIALIPRGAISL